MLRLILSLSFLLLPSLARAQREYGFDNTKSSNQPYLPPEESVKRMKVPDGFEVKLFAAEPMLVNPIAMTVDEKGRVWAIESFEYPKRTPKGQAPRDRIIILEDTNGDGVADKKSIFAEGKDFPVPPERAAKGLGAFDMASGLEVGYGGCFVGAPPYLWHLKAVNNPDKAEKFDILASGFGSQDTHETLNTFTWGPDGWLYGLHGVFTTSKVVTKPGESSIDMDAAVWRFHPRLKKFEIFAEGTSNPWGMDFNSQGDFFICACVIPHLYHIVPGGIYIKQGNKPSHNPYAYGALREICDHTFHKESGWAHAGLLCLDTPIMPKELQSSVIFGSIHGNSIKRNILQRNGSTYIARKAPDFLTSGDKNFRPVSLKWGPGGDIFVTDWHDQHPCHQTKADEWDYEHGRIYRIVNKSTPRIELSNFASLDNFSLYRRYHFSSDPWELRSTYRLLQEKKLQFTSVLRPTVIPLRGSVWEAESNFMRELFFSDTNELGKLIQQMERGLAVDDNSTFRNWYWRIWELIDRDTQSLVTNTKNASTSVRLFGNRFIQQMAGCASIEKDPAVRAQLASVVFRNIDRHDLSPVLFRLIHHTEDASDPVIPFLLWLAFEKQITKNPKDSIAWLQTNAVGNPLIIQHIVARSLRRLAASGKPDELSLALNFLESVPDQPVRLAALSGLAEAFRNRQVPPPEGWSRVAALLRKDPNPEIHRLVLTLAASFGDPEVIKSALQTFQDVNKPQAQRVEAIRQLATLRAPGALPILLTATKQEPHPAVRLEAARSLSAFDHPSLAKEILQNWKSYPPFVKAELVQVLRSRKPWAKSLLQALGQGTVARSDLNDNIALAIHAFKDSELDALVEKHYGKFRDSPAELQALVETLKKEIPASPGDPTQGKLVFEKHCMQCHKFNGQGHDVGPNLDGAQRSFDYLITNIVDPNRVVGTPYFSRTILLKSGKLLTGLLIEEDSKTLRLKRENGILEIITKSEIDEQNTSQKSLMPENLSANISRQELRDLIWYLNRDRK